MRKIGYLLLMILLIHLHLFAQKESSSQQSQNQKASPSLKNDKVKISLDSFQVSIKNINDSLDKLIINTSESFCEDSIFLNRLSGLKQRLDVILDTTKVKSFIPILQLKKIRNKKELDIILDDLRIEIEIVQAFYKITLCKKEEINDDTGAINKCDSFPEIPLSNRYNEANIQDYIYKHERDLDTNMRQFILRNLCQIKTDVESKQNSIFWKLSQNQNVLLLDQRDNTVSLFKVERLAALLRINKRLEHWLQMHL